MDAVYVLLTIAMFALLMLHRARGGPAVTSDLVGLADRGARWLCTWSLALLFPERF